MKMLFLIAFFVTSSGYAFAASGSIDRLEASVNSTLILLSDVVKFRETIPLRSQLDPLFAGTQVANQGAKSSDKDIVQFLVDEKLIQGLFPVADSEVEQEINSIMNNNHIDRDTLKKTLANQGFAYEDYFELIRASAAKRNLIDRDIRTKVSVSDDDVKNYYFNHYAKSGNEAKSYRVKIITVSRRSYKTAAAAKETVERAAKRVRSGESFEEVAKSVSDDPSSATGGDLGLLSEEQMSPQIRTELKKLKVGQVSGILGNPNTSFFILKLADIAASEGSGYDRMKEEIRAQLAASEYQHQILLWLERQRQIAFIHLAGEPSVTGLIGTH